MSKQTERFSGTQQTISSIKKGNLHQFKNKLLKLHQLVVEYLFHYARSPHKNKSQKTKVSENIKQLKSLSLLKDVVSEKSFSDYFKIVCKIGEGAHSTVYKCRALVDNCEYAVKIPKKNDIQLVQRMRSGYQIIKALNHKFIGKAKFLFIQEKHQSCQIVFQYYQYPTLKEFIFQQFQRYKFIDESTIAMIIRKILIAVAYLHEKKVCHRDLKPQNILFNSLTEEIKIIDFETARMQRYTHEKLDLMTKTGTEQYRAPQSYTEGGYTFGVDLWAVGIITYEMFMGEYPFTGSYMHDVKNSILQKQINYDKLEISNSAKRFISKLLTKNPENRISVNEALSDSFLLKHLKSDLQTCVSPMNSSFDRMSPSKNQAENSDIKNGFYDDDLMDNFLGNLRDEQGIMINPE